MAFDRESFLPRFLEEACEQCAVLGRGLVALEQSPGHRETLDEVFRAAHTIKGSARMIKLLPISETAHRLEDLLDAVRNGSATFESSLSDLALEAVDAIGTMLDRVSGGDEAFTAPQELLARLRAAAGGESAQGAAPASEGVAVAREAAPSAVEGGGEGRAKAAETTSEPPRKRPAAAGTVRISADKLDDLIRLMGEIVSVQQQNKQVLAELRDTVRLSQSNLRHVSGLQDRMVGVPREISEDALRLHAVVKRLSAKARDAASLQEILTGEFQERALRMRMLPLSTVFDALPRTVRDLAAASGKAIEFVTEGGETELDRKIIEKLGESLLHMIRNAVDHGIEPGAERVAAGKSERGKLTLSARYEAGSVVVRLADDGRGISVENVRNKALAKRFFDEEALRKMSTPELLDLIFLPGFSTSAIVSDLSGRGVGMDVVKRNIVEDLKGSIGVVTEEGGGTAFVMRLPPTLALFRLLLVETRGSVFALPATAVREVVPAAAAEPLWVLDRRAIRLRDEMIPIEGLDTLLAVPGEGAPAQGSRYVIVVGTGVERLGLIVDELLTEEDMVVKPLPAHMKNAGVVSGATIGGRNEVIQVLNVTSLIQLARGAPRAAASADRAKAAPKRPSVLVVDDSFNTREIEKSVLEAHGYAVVLAGDGEEALEKTRDAVFDLVITDVEMPRLDGFSLTGRLRHDPRYSDVPIVIVTSRAKEEDRRRGIEVGANAYIVKGDFDQLNLIDTVANLIG